MPISYTLADLKSTFPLAFFERGQSIFQQQRVNRVGYDHDHSTLLAEVRGSRSLPYHQRIQINLRNYKLVIDGACDCPIGRNCKHVIAVLIHALQTPPDSHQDMSAPPRAQVQLQHRDAAQHWLQNVGLTAAKINAPAETGTESSRLLYVLSPASRGSGIDIQLMRARVKKDDNLGKPMRYTQFTEIALGRGGAIASYLDRTLCARIHLCHPQTPDWPRISGPNSGQLLHDLILTQRVYWLSTQHAALSIGDAQPCELSWIADEQDNQQLSILLSEDEHLLMVEPPWRINTRTRVCNALHSGLPDALVNILIQSPPIPNDLLPDISALLQQQLPDVTLPTPQTLRTVELPDTTPQPVLILREMTVSLDAHWQRRDDHNNSHQLPVAMLMFDYHTLRVSAANPNIQASQRRDQVRHVTQRNLPVERDLMQQLQLETALVSLHRAFPSVALSDEHSGALSLFHPSEWLNLMLDDIPLLREQGWIVEIHADFPFRVADAQGEISIDIEEHTDNDWFGLDLGIDVDGERISLLPILSQTFRQYTPEQIRELTLPNADSLQKLVCMLPDKRMLGLPLSRLQGILSVLVELFDSNTKLNSDGQLELHTLHASRLAEIEAQAQMRWMGGQRMLEMGRKLRTFIGINEVAPPVGLTTELRGYQQEGLNWLQFLREFGLAGILADDMGLGKTLQALAHLLIEKQSGRADLPSLVIAPTSLMFNWRAEAARFTPQLKVLLLHGNERKQHFSQLADYDLVLTTYPLLSRDREFLTAQHFHLLILDEAHAIKNPKSLATQIVHQLHARHRLALTGTPMENHLGELWSLFHFLLPGLLGNAEAFKRQFRTPIEKHDDKQRSHTLSQRIKPFLLRRTKAEVATELPPKTDIIRSCELVGEQRDLYESVRSVMHDKIRREIDAKGFRKSQIVILDALLKLRQVCCDPRLLKLPTARKVLRSAKLDMLISLLPNMLEEGRRILLFSQFTSMLDLIEPELHLLKIPFVRLTGETQDRALPVTRFQNGEVPLFLISLKAGGVGLNLTAADTVIHYDPWWNPAVEDQATGRAHRIGQVNPVFAWKLTTIGTVEEKILLMQDKKRNLAQGVLGDTGTGVGTFTPDELISLFEAD